MAKDFAKNHPEHIACAHYPKYPEADLQRKLVPMASFVDFHTCFLLPSRHPGVLDLRMDIERGQYDALRGGSLLKKGICRTHQD
jgi:hypothetical protein